MNKRAQNNSNKKTPLIIGGVVALIVAIIIGSFMSKGKSEVSNENLDKNEPIRVEVEQKLEYGDDIEDKTFTIHTDDETKDANFADLDPEVDTMKVGKTEHTLELEDDVFDVTVTVEDTQNPVLKGVKDFFELEDEEIDLEEALKKLITAEDPVDGELEVTFEINETEENESHYNVTAKAADENGNKTAETFEVVIKVVKEEKEVKAEKKDEKDPSPPVASKPENDPKPNQEKPKQQKPKQEQPKQEKPKQEQPKKEEPKKEEPKKEEPKKEASKVEEYQCSGGIMGPGIAPPNEPPLNDPVAPLPDGASLTKKEKSYHYYSYNRSLPGGGSITEVMMSYGNCELSVNISGKDNNGDPFGSNYVIETGQMWFPYIIEKPALTDDDKPILFEIGRAFARSYGLY